MAKGGTVPAFQKLQVDMSSAPWKWYNKVKCTAFFKAACHLNVSCLKHQLYFLNGDFFSTDHGLYVKYNEVDVVVFISLMLTICTSQVKPSKLVRNSKKIEMS